MSQRSKSLTILILTVCREILILEPWGRPRPLVLLILLLLKVDTMMLETRSVSYLRKPLRLFAVVQLLNEGEPPDADSRRCRGVRHGFLRTGSQALAAIRIDSRSQPLGIDKSDGASPDDPPSEATTTMDLSKW